MSCTCGKCPGRGTAEAQCAEARDRRVRELVREWLRRTASVRGQNHEYPLVGWGPDEMQALVNEAARLIDALDDAEVPPKSAEGKL